MGEKVMGKVIDLQTRFWSKVDKEGPGGCWVWRANKVWGGYGHIRVGKRMILAHRIAYEFANGDIPDGKQIDHVCHNRSCVNPAHLRVASNKENARNMLLRSDNTSGFKGVSFCKPLCRWKASLRKDGKDYYLGLYDTAEDAQRAYCEAAKKLFGEFYHDGVK